MMWEERPSSGGLGLDALDRGPAGRAHASASAPSASSSASTVPGPSIASRPRRIKPGVGDLRRELLAGVEERGGEPARDRVGVAMRPSATSWATMLAERRVAEPVVDERVQERRVAGDRRGHHDAAGRRPRAPPPTALRTRSSRSVRWYSGPNSSTASKEASSHGSSRASPSTVSATPAAARLLEVQRHRIQQRHLVAAPAEPGRVVARPAAHVGDPCGRRRQEPLEQPLGPVALERDRRPAAPAPGRRRSSGGSVRRGRAWPAAYGSRGCPGRSFGSKMSALAARGPERRERRWPSAPRPDRPGEPRQLRRRACRSSGSTASGGEEPVLVASGARRQRRDSGP